VNILLRKAAISDAPTLEEIERESFSHPHWDAASLLRYECTVAELDGRVVGFIIVRETFAPEHEILNLAVGRGFRGRGIASALLEHQLRKGGTHFLEVRESNTIAQSLYRKYGFVEVGRRSGYYDLPPETAIVMRMN
jgi:ribosomal-protein-alanine N-acetyltransferase